MAGLGFVTHTIVPEMVRFTSTNRINTYKNITSVAVGPHGLILFLCYDDQKKVYKLYKSKLHNPIQDIELDPRELEDERMGLAERCCSSSEKCSPRNNNGESWNAT